MKRILKFLSMFFVLVLIAICFAVNTSLSQAELYCSVSKWVDGETTHWAFVDDDEFCICQNCENQEKSCVGGSPEQ